MHISLLSIGSANVTERSTKQAGTASASSNTIFIHESTAVTQPSPELRSAPTTSSWTQQHDVTTAAPQEPQQRSGWEMPPQAAPCALKIIILSFLVLLGKTCVQFRPVKSSSGSADTEGYVLR